MADDDIFDPGVADILGQDDIDSLLQQMGGGDDPAQGASTKSPVIGGDGRRLGDDEIVSIEPYDFRNPAFLGESEMRRLRLMHEDFIRFLEARFALFLRMDFSLSMTRLTTVPYEQAINEVENPSHIVLFKAAPMPGMGFLEINPRLALTVASSILGGKGTAPRMERYLTKIEVDLIEEFLFILLQEWCSQWKTETSMEPSIMGHEVVASVLQLCEHDTIMLSLAMDAELRGCSGRIGISVPLYMIEGAVREMQDVRRREGQPPRQRINASWRSGFGMIPVQGVAEISLGSMKIKDVAQWAPGTFIPFDEDVLQKVALKLAGVPLFECNVGAEDEQVALEIKGKIQKKGSPWKRKR